MYTSAHSDTSPGVRFGIRGGTHDFAGVRALTNVDFYVTAGEVHGLVGQNGSGKSTLLKILTGALEPTAGEILLNGKRQTFSTPSAAQREGIGVVHQDYNLFPELSVAANVYGVSKSPPRKRWTLTVDRRELERRVAALFAELDIDLPPGIPVRLLGPAERKFVEIARAMLLRPDILFLDEPTASLEPEGSSRVIALISRLRARGVGLAFVSHRLDEVLEISDRVTVLRNGEVVHTSGREGLSERALAELVVGDGERPRHEVARHAASSDVMVRVRGLHLEPGLPAVELDIRRGEIFGLTGLLGSGAADVVHMLGGARPFRGEVEVGGIARTIRNPRDAQQAGIGFIPEDRKAVGLIQDQSISMNVSLSSLGNVSRFGWISDGERDAVADSYKAALDIRAPSVRAIVRTLSGGNQQKVMLAKWLAAGKQVLAIEEPTHGIDVGGKTQVHALLRQFAADGGTVIVASTDVEEVLDLCDRVAIMRHRALSDVIDSHDLTLADLVASGALETDLLERLDHSDRGSRS